MGPLLVELLIGSLVGGAAFWALRFQNRRWLEGWHKLALACDLTDIEEGSWMSPHLQARRGSLRVRLGRYQRSKSEYGTGIVLTDVSHWLAGLELRPEDLGTAFQKALPLALGGSREVEVGDKLFDGAFYVGGAPARVHALLDSETRLRLLRLGGLGRLTLAQGELRVEVPEEHSLPSFLQVRDTLERALEVAEMLTGRAGMAERLAHNARHDPSSAARLKCLLVLLREFGDTPQVRETLKAACGDHDPEVRLRAAGALGSEGVPTLLALAEDASLGDAYAAAAVTALGRSLPFEHALDLLQRSLGGRTPETARACLASLGAHGARAVAPLARVLSTERGAVAEAAAQALGATAAPGAEPPLLAALADPRGEARLAAAEALGRVGGVAAVLPLKECLEGLGRSERALARAARQAVALIQSRLPGASPGQLSLATSEAGQLSLADEGGRLSLPEREPGALSLADEAAPRSPATRVARRGQG